MATAHGVPANTSEALADLERAQNDIKKLLKSGALTEAEAKRAQKEAKRDFREYMKNSKAARTSLSKAKQKRPVNEDEENDEKPEKEPWPCSNMDTCITAEEYDSWEDGVAAVKAAFLANSLFEEVDNCKEKATNRAKKPGGSGAGKRGYLDWEFEVDGNKIGCRCAIRNARTLIRVDMR